MSLRIKLTVWFLIIFACIQATLALLVVVYQRQTILSVFDERLAMRGRAVAEYLSLTGPPWDSTRLEAAASGESERVFFDQFIIDVFDADGEALATSAQGGTPGLSPAVRGRVLPVSLSPSFGSFTVAPDGGAGARNTRYRAATMAFRNGPSTYIVRVSTRTTYIDSVLSNTGLVMLATIPAGLIAALLAGWFVVGLAMSPLRRMIEAAAHLSPQQMGGRLDMKAGPAEIADLQRELNEALDRIERGYRSQERFISNVSHEIKTPIAVVLAESQTVGLEAPENERLAAYARSVGEEMRRLARLVESFLMLTRLEQGDRRVRQAPCATNDVVLESVEYCLRQAEHHGVELAPTFTEESTAASVSGDRDLLRTMIDNIIRNAIRFSPPGSRVEIEARVADSGQSVLIVVRDQGAGIPAELLDRIFDRFEPRHGQPRRRGHGLGLSIAQGVAELHGGSIRAENRAGGGCAFTITLPRNSAAADATSDRVALYAQ